MAMPIADTLASGTANTGNPEMAGSGGRTTPGEP